MAGFFVVVFRGTFFLDFPLFSAQSDDDDDDDVELEEHKIDRLFTNRDLMGPRRLYVTVNLVEGHPWF